MSKIKRVVSQCKTNHGGPLISKEELLSIVENTKDEKELGKILDLRSDTENLPGQR